MKKSPEEIKNTPAKPHFTKIKIAKAKRIHGATESKTSRLIPKPYRKFSYEKCILFNPSIAKIENTNAMIEEAALEFGIIFSSTFLKP